MAGLNTTLRRVLCQQKPPISCKATATRNSTNWIWPELKNCVTIWDDFSLDNLNNSYGWVLDFAVPESLLVVPRSDQALAGVAINTAEDINHLIGWNDGLMQPTLQFAKSQLRLHPGIILRHDYSTADKSVLARLPGAPMRLTVDHVIALDDFPGPNLVVGLGRTSSKWSGRKLANQLDNAKMGFLWPLRQLAKICEIAGTRYGYIQTEEELVVCCFSKNAEAWKVAIMPIPWSRYGIDVLTTDLALWWLCMLAMSAHHHRNIVKEEEMVKINDWDIVFLDQDRGWVRRHRYSKFEEPTSPPPPPGYRTPTPGTADVFAADVSLHANDWFNIEDPVHTDFTNLADFSAANFHDFDAANFDESNAANFGLDHLGFQRFQR